MAGDKCFKKITNEDIYRELVHIRNLAQSNRELAMNNKSQIKNLWVLFLMLFSVLLGIIVERII